MQRIAKWGFDNAPGADWGVNEARGYACEFVAWQYLCHLTKHESIEFLLEELPATTYSSTGTSTLGEAERGTSARNRDSQNEAGEAEATPLLRSSSSSLFHLFSWRVPEHDSERLQVKIENATANEQISVFIGLSALEIATIAHAKKFLSQRVVQRVIDDIWRGEIIFWDSLSVHSRKRPRVFNRK